MHHVGVYILFVLVFICTAFTLFHFCPRELDMDFSRSYVSLFFATVATAVAVQNDVKVDLSWHAPKKSWINDLDQVLNSTGTNGFRFNSSQLPAGVKYGTYNWCNMPHVRKEEYVKADEEFELVYVEVIHRHHKRTPYASNTFPKESYSWECSNQGLFYYGEPLHHNSNTSASTYWNVYTNPVNPFARPGFNGSCQFPQITSQGLDDSWQHGADLYAVYHDLLHFLPSSLNNKITYRVTNNVITSQVAGMLIQAIDRLMLFIALVSTSIVLYTVIRRCRCVRPWRLMAFSRRNSRITFVLLSRVNHGSCTAIMSLMMVLSPGC
ncbi:conserved hypothetical protein [Pyrenophora tritici-repentis Pt-1C-BFP]|uniref:Uncharacterized protein n=1 Tax=Pyrenophora tritici-repentis (strain Pt-1C-BFP) TaxID=426418 RepID=B2WBE1_PYRTR|nr:uncharacterized protein PTRG_06953 [Pyrenophora tritici-repentis Pt-1C-BFP]EDU49873.1 conserved hypothetical protein [Pyrenophora tritici-repentis Pt-1C-BFP]